MSNNFLSELLTWLNTRMAPPGICIEADTELFRNGLIGSLRVLELIAWTERATGRRIPDVMIQMNNFQSPRAIATTFALEADHVVS